MSANIYEIFLNNPASSMLATDLFYLGRSPYDPTNSMAITWANVKESLSITSSNIYVANNGSDSTGNGKLLTPYQTIAYAMTQITTESPTTPFTIVLLDNYYTESAQIKLKPNVSITGPTAGCIINNSLTIIADTATWTALPTSGNCYIQNATINNTISLDVSIATGGSASPYIQFNNVTFNDSLTVIGNGTTHLYLNNNINNDNFSTINSYVSSYNNFYSSSFQVGGSTGQTSSTNFNSFSDIFDGPVLIQTAASATFESIMQVVGGTFNNTVTLDGNMASINYDVDSYVLPSLLNGASAPTIPLIAGSGITVTPFTSNNQTVYRISAPASLYPRGYLYGLETAPSFGNFTQFTVNAGVCIDSTNVLNMSLPSGYTGDMSVSGVGGLDTGTFAANKIYCVYVIGDSTGVNAAAIVVSLGQNGPTVMPSGYNKYRFIMAIFSNSSTHLFKAICSGSGVYKDVIVDFLSSNIILSSGTSSGQTSIGLIDNYLPDNGFVQKIKFAAQFTAATVTDYARVTPDGFSIATNGAPIVIGNGVLTQVDFPFELEPSPAFEIDYLVDHTGAGNSSLTLGITGFTLAL